MKITVKENECFFKISIEPEGNLTFRYGFNLHNAMNKIEEGHPSADALIAAVSLIAGIVHMTKEHPEDLMDIGESAIDSGDFVVNDTGQAEMAEFLSNLSDEDLELLETPVKGEA